MIYKQAQIDKYLKKPEPLIKGFVVYGANDGLVSEYPRSVRRDSQACSPAPI